MRLYYALGGGLGHLTRATAVLEALDALDPSGRSARSGRSGETALLTASPFARDPRVTRGLSVIGVPRELGRDRDALAAWTQRTLDALAPAELIIDTFPGGILGELCQLQLPPAAHIARCLRWDAYAPRLSGPLPRFRATYAVEALAVEQHRRLQETSERLERVALPAAGGTGDARPLLNGPHWLVVHSGPDHETVDLVRYAAELRAAENRAVPIAVISPARPSWLPADAVWRDVYPAHPHFHHAERIVTAAGFNVIRETEPMRDRHWCVPYERRFDDQFARAAAARRDSPTIS